jgi:hypothetical protein
MGGASARRSITIMPMRGALRVLATVVLLVGPTVLAFFSGGYFDGPRAVAAAVAWALVLLLALAGPLPFPLGRSGRIALAGLLGLAAWSALSLLWAPLAGPAFDSVERLLLYTGVLLAAVALLRDPRAAAAVEPALALGIVIVIGYGLSGRLAPGIIDLITARSFGAGGRLEQPITYWNAEGLLAAMGLVLSVRIAGDSLRGAPMRIAAAAACAPLGMGVYLSYSRGALAVALLGLIVLLAAAPSRSQLRAAVLGLGAGVVAASCSSALPGVASLAGTASERERDGLVMLAVLVVVVAATAVLARWVVAAERRGAMSVGPVGYAQRLPAVAAAATALCVAGLVVGGLRESAGSGESAGAAPSRLASVSSLRYEYWRVGADAFWSHPVKGVGAGAFRVAWRQNRRVEAGANEVHSLFLEQATELGLPGLAFLVIFLGGVASAGRRALASGSRLAVGACATCIVWLLHAAIDWDLQVPGVTLPALILAAGLLAASEPRAPDPVPVEWARAPSREEPAAVVAG